MTEITTLPEEIYGFQFEPREELSEMKYRNVHLYLYLERRGSHLCALLDAGR